MEVYRTARRSSSKTCLDLFYSVRPGFANSSRLSLRAFLRQPWQFLRIEPWFDKLRSKGYQRVVLDTQLLLKPTYWRRWVGVVLFLAVFSLPLHFHAIAATSQVTKECSCLHGNRMQMGAAAAPGDSVAVVASEPVVLLPRKEVGHRFIVPQSSRAPPPQVGL